jgi:hypothetical protein
MASFPSDIVYHILRPTSGDRAVDLAMWKNAALVAQSWRWISQKHLFHELNLSLFKREQEPRSLWTYLQRIICFFEEHPHLAGHVQRLTCTLNGAQELILKDGLMERFWAAFPQVLTVYITQHHDEINLFPVIAGFPHLETLLYMDHNPSPAMDRPLVHLIPSLQLATVKFAGEPAACNVLLKALASTESRVTMRRFEVTWLTEAEDSVPAFSEQLDELSHFTHLEHIVIDMSIVDAEPSTAYKNIQWYSGAWQLINAAYGEHNPNISTCQVQARFCLPPCKN